MLDEIEVVFQILIRHVGEKLNDGCGAEQAYREVAAEIVQALHSAKVLAKAS